MNIVFVFLVMKLLNGSVVALTQPAQVVGDDPSLICEVTALDMVQKQKSVDKFDYACFPPPDFDSDPAASEMIDLMKKDIAKHSA